MIRIYARQAACFLPEQLSLPPLSPVSPPPSLPSTISALHPPSPTPSLLLHPVSPSLSHLPSLPSTLSPLHSLSSHASWPSAFFPLHSIPFTSLHSAFPPLRPVSHPGWNERGRRERGWRVGKAEGRESGGDRVWSGQSMEGRCGGGARGWRGERVAEQRGWQRERVQASLLFNLSPYTPSPVRLPFPPPSLSSALSPLRLLSPAPSLFYGLRHILLLPVRLCPSPLLSLVPHTSVSHSPLLPVRCSYAPLSSSSFPFSPFRLCSHSPIAPSPPFFTVRPCPLSALFFCS